MTRSLNESSRMEDGQSRSPELIVAADLIESACIEDWKVLRGQGLTGTDASIICGTTRKYGSRYELFLKKTGALVEVEETFAKPEDYFGPRYWGIAQEPLIRQAFVEDTGLTVMTDPEFSVRRSKTQEWMLGTPDGYIWCPDRGWGILEIKTAGLFLESEWKHGRVPKNYLVQVQHYMELCDLDYAYFATLIGGQKYRKFFIPRDRDFCSRLVQEEQRFWDLIQSNHPPELDGHPATTAAVGVMHSEFVDEARELPSEASRWDEQRAKAIEMQAEAQDLRCEAENKIKNAIGDCAYGILPDGGGRYSWKGKPRRLLRMKD